MRNYAITSAVLLLAVACTPLQRPDDRFPGGRQVDLAWGKKVYDTNCAGCHDTGRNGAQIIGDQAGWSSRVDRGLDALVKNAIEGYSGALGYMPPRGGNPALSHEDVTAAAAYIVESSLRK